MAALSKLNVTNPTNSEENQVIINDTHVENPQPTPDLTPIKLPTADSDVLAFLKEKLLGDAGKVVE